MIIHLRSPLGERVGTYEADFKPAIGERILLSLDAHAEIVGGESKESHWRVVDVIHLAFNTAKFENVLPYNRKLAELVITVEPDEIR